VRKGDEGMAMRSIADVFAALKDSRFDNLSECQETLLTVVDQMRLFLEEA